MLEWRFFYSLFSQQELYLVATLYKIDLRQMSAKVDVV